MASRHPLPPPSKIVATLRYFDKYDYPLTKEELIYWQSPVTHPFSPPLFIKEKGRGGEFYFLPGRQEIVKIRSERGQISQQKWQIAKQISDKLKAFPTIQAIFITGSLAMNSTTQNDDIDFMVVTSANTLWMTRFFINIFLHSQRRFPNQTQVNNKICPNLWLDENNLAIPDHNLYTAHEILQAKVLWDRNNIQNKFLSNNTWVNEYLPNAYCLTLGPSPDSGEGGRSREKFSIFKIVNLVFFIIQYLYMRPKMTTERVAPGFAFFHPSTRD